MEPDADVPAGQVALTARQLFFPASPTAEMREQLSLGLGAVMIVDKPAVVRTVLGSCVAVILHVPRLRLSAICHAQMPEREDGTCCEGCSRPCRAPLLEANDAQYLLRYVVCSIQYMLGELRRRAVAKGEIICTLVGGANVLRDIDSRWSVADRNVRTATRLLKREGISIHYSDTGGTHGRVIEHSCDLNRTKVKYHPALA